ncbi:MAG: cytochrome c biogenesis protein CcsA [Deltaproteobacteria bacterium]|nr:cytochrome c biogenesis protein CcsA [Deltaproteobacteria bacterium]
MSNLGQVTMWLGLIAIGISSVCYAVVVSGKDSEVAKNAARLSFVAFSVFVTIASMLLMHFILNHEFVYSYVARYSSRDLSLEYLVSSFWAGQEGSFLLWVLLGAWLGIFLMFRARNMEPHVMLIYNLNNVFLMILLIKQSPFHMLPLPPPDGNGLNMLLQDPWMVIHPPIVFLGYAAFTIPFAYAVSALWRREYDAWIKPALPWTAFAFVSLGAGIIIGGYWSYKVLGWGGYWGWDPVENASLLPWLAGMALMHGMILQKTRGKLRKTNFMLAAFSFLLVIYCTFLTRSGVLADFSVHSFVDLGITGWLVIFMFAFIAISIFLFVTRAKEIPVSKKGENPSYFSREFGLIAAMILLCLSTLVTGLGTSAPLITRMLEQASKVSTEFYVNTNLPLALFMLLLLSFVPLMAWGKNSFSKVGAKAKWAGAGAVVALVITLLNGYPDMEAPLLSLGVLLLSILGGAVTGMNLLLATKLIRKKITISSGAIAHLGVGLMFLGIVASSAYDRSEKLLLPQDTVKSVLGYEIMLNGPQFSREGKGMRLHFPLDIKRRESQFTAKPDIYSERGRGGKMQRFTHPHIRKGLMSDLYISPLDFEPGQEKGSGNSLDLKRGNKIAFHDYELEFTGFDVSGMMGQDARNMTVGANIVASYKGDDRATLKPVITMSKKHGPSSPSSRVKLPGPDDAYLTLERIDAGAKTIGLVYEGPGSASEKSAEKSPPAVIAEVSIKPGMTVLWLGTFLILVGGSIAVVRRWPK